MKKWFAAGALGIAVIAVIFGRSIATSVGRMEERPAQTKITDYKQARRELADPTPASVNNRTELPQQEGAAAERLRSYEKRLVEVGYWRTPESKPQQVGSSPIESRREEMNKRARAR